MLRLLPIVGTLAVALWLSVSAAPSRPKKPPNPVMVENARTGDPAWQARQAAFRYAEGYTTRPSVLPGETLELHVQTTPAARYRVDIYRLGWYGGAGARRLACLPSCSTDEQGVPQPVPPFDPATGLVRADWPVTDRELVPSGWVSGYYLAKIVLTRGGGSGTTASVPFIVRASPARRSAMLVEAPVNTWEAYDDWGGRGLYVRVNNVWTNHASFDRPFLYGEQGPFEWEYQLVRFLEREGYDVSYTTNVDVDADPGELQRHRLVIVAGHDEYWSKTIRDAFQAARDAGTNLAFVGGNTGYWQIRYEDDRRTLVEYRIPGNDPEPNGALKTTLFRKLLPPRPECELLGVQWQTGIGLQSDLPVNDAALTDPWFARSGFAPGATVAGLVGGEWDGVLPGCATPPLTVFFHFGGAGDKGPADVIRYTAASGARVFDAGTLRFSWGLDPFGTGLAAADPRLQQFMRNALDDLTRPAPPIALTATRTGDSVALTVLLHPDPRVATAGVYRLESLSGRLHGVRVCKTTSSCTDAAAPPGRLRYFAVAEDQWRVSYPTVAEAPER